MFSSKDIFFGSQSTGGYQVTKSLRFRSSASAYLSKTFSGAGNRTVWTFSCWVKRGKIGARQELLCADSNGTTDASDIFFDSSDKLNVQNLIGSAYKTQRITNAVFRDPSAWYHVVVSQNGSTACNVYINGVSQTFGTSTGPDASNWYINSTTPQSIGNDSYLSNGYLDGYLAEVNFIGGAALDASSFGAYDATTGVWMPKAYTGSYSGTNSYYLKFSDTTSTTTLCYDYSGNSNNWTPNNISLTSGTTYDSMLDSPTNYADGGNGRGNYCVFNPLDIGPGSVTEANLVTNVNISASTMRSTIGMSSGKWYAEYTVNSTGDRGPGLATASAGRTTALGDDAYGWAYLASGNKRTNNSSTAYGNTYTTNDVIGIAFDADAGSLYFYKNGAVQNSGTAAFTSLTSGPYFFASGASAAAVVGYWNFGQRPFVYSNYGTDRPANTYLALNTQNMTTPTILNGASYMAAVTYTGNGTTTGNTQTITATTTNSGNNPLATTFQPDLVWMKSRSTTQWHILVDSVRGTNKTIYSNDTYQEESVTNVMNSFNTDGFTAAYNSAYTSVIVNKNSDTYVAWEWKGGGTGVSNTSGSITSTVSANQTAGFSVVTFTAPSSGSATVGHGLGVAPSMIILKSRSNADNWTTYHQSLGSSSAVSLNLTNASSALTWGTINSSIFSVDTGTNVTASRTYVAYCFAPVSGYSAFGSYTGNGSTDGPMIFTNFRPRWFMTKRTDVANDWAVYDSSRDTYNVVSNELYPDLSSAESATARMDFLSNGVKIRNIGAFQNASGGTYIYAAFAENPFTIARAR